MAATQEQRRLAAILSADVVGYGRLMEADESATLAALTEHRKVLIEPKVGEHNGRIVKLLGDGILAEFVSAVDAVRCAVEIQKAMPARSANVPEDQRVRFRVGINVGDIIVEDDDIYGDGVNIAARVQELAEPDGVCLSGTAYDQVRGKLDFELTDLGEIEIKNIARPINAWQWTGSEERAGVGLKSRKSKETTEKPSIAVLPFDNLSNDPEQRLVPVVHGWDPRATRRAYRR